MSDAAWERRRDDGHVVSTDRARMDLDRVHRWIAAQYWAPAIERGVFLRSLERALCFGLFEWDRQVGFARVITDGATFAYLADVFVLPSHRGRGLARWLMECVRAHPELQGLRRFLLFTRDAHGLYARFGFEPLAQPEYAMCVYRPDVYGSVS